MLKIAAILFSSLSLNAEEVVSRWDQVQDVAVKVIDTASEKIQSEREYRLNKSRYESSLQCLKKSPYKKQLQQITAFKTPNIQLSKEALSLRAEVSEQAVDALISCSGCHYSGKIMFEDCSVTRVSKTELERQMLVYADLNGELHRSYLRLNSFATTFHNFYGEAHSSAAGALHYQWNFFGTDFYKTIAEMERNLLKMISLVQQNRDGRYVFEDIHQSEIRDFLSLFNHQLQKTEKDFYQRL